MAITYKWSIAALDCYPEHSGFNNVVFTAHWLCDAKDGSNTSGVYGSVGLSFDPTAPFTDFDDLMEEQVVGWVKDALGAEQVETYEATAASQVEALANPSATTPQLPWV